jgi:hypothetical protein
MGRPVSEILAGGGFGGLGGGKGGNDGKASEGQPLRSPRLDRIELTSSLPFYPQVTLVRAFSSGEKQDQS